MAVALAFDLDGPTGDAMLDGSIWAKPEYFGLGAYGPWRALPRLLDLLDSHAVPATFFVPAWVMEQWPERCRDIVARGHEIAHHGYRHERYFGMEESAQRQVIRKSQRIFEDVVGAPAEGFRTPAGDWSLTTARILLEEGFSYSSTMRGDDRPYRHVINGSTTDLIEIPAHWEFDDYAHFAYQRNPDYPAGQDRISGYARVLSSWEMEFDGYWRDGLCLTTLLHPKVSGKPGRILLLDELLTYMQGREDVWFATLAEVARWWRDREEQHDE